MPLNVVFIHSQNTEKEKAEEDRANKRQRKVTFEDDLPGHPSARVFMLPLFFYLMVMLNEALSIFFSGIIR